MHYCCAKCQTYSESNITCTVCQSTNFIKFFELGLAEQIKFLFEERGLATAIDKHRGSSNFDINSGSEYKEIRKTLTGKYDIILELNADGVRVSNKTNCELWPPQYTVVDVAPDLRPSYLMVCGIWYGEKKTACWRHSGPQFLCGTTAIDLVATKTLFLIGFNLNLQAMMPPLTLLLISFN